MAGFLLLVDVLDWIFMGRHLCLTVYIDNCPTKRTNYAPAPAHNVDVTKGRQLIKTQQWEENALPFSFAVEAEISIRAAGKANKSQP